MCGGAILSDIIAPPSANRSRKLTADLLWNSPSDSYDDFEAAFQGFKNDTPFAFSPSKHFAPTSHGSLTSDEKSGSKKRKEPIQRDPWANGLLKYAIQTKGSVFGSGPSIPLKKLPGPTTLKPEGSVVPKPSSTFPHPLIIISPKTTYQLMALWKTSQNHRWLLLL